MLGDCIKDPGLGIYVDTYLLASWGLPWAWKMKHFGPVFTVLNTEQTAILSWGKSKKKKKKVLWGHQHHTWATWAELLGPILEATHGICPQDMVHSYLMRNHGVPWAAEEVATHRRTSGLQMHAAWFLYEPFLKGFNPTSRWACSFLCSLI